MSITLEEGKFYRRRDGRKVGPLCKRDSVYVSTGYYWTAETRDRGNNWFNSGRFTLHSESEYDLVAEWVDEKAPEDIAAAAAVEGVNADRAQVAALSVTEGEDSKGGEYAEVALGDPGNILGSIEAEMEGDTVAYKVDNWQELKSLYEEALSEAKPKVKMPEPFTHGDAFEGMRPPGGADIKVEIADTAKNIVAGARRAAYGTPEQNFERIAAMWSAYAKAKGWPVEFEAGDVSPMMILMKLARIVESPDHKDSFIDVVGYALTGAEVNKVA